MNGVWLRESFFLSVYNSISIELVTEGLPWWWSHPGQSQIRVLSWIAYSYHPVKKAWQAITELHQSYKVGYGNVVDSSRPFFMYQMTYCTNALATAWLNENSCNSMVLPSPWHAEHPPHYTISFPHHRLLWFTRHWMVYTEGRVCSRCLAKY